MRFTDSFYIAFNNLKANKWRAGLTILGIVIGIGAVISMMSIGQGAQKMIISQMSSLGSNNVFVEPGAWSSRMEQGTMMQSMMEEFEIKTLTYDDALAIAKLASVDMAAPFVMGVSRVVAGNESKKLTYYGTTPETAAITDIKCILGRNLDEQDVKSMAKVVVLGYKTREDLFGSENPVGKTIRIQKINFRVIGVLEEVGPQAMMSIDDSLYVPLTTAQKLLLGIDFVRFVIVKAKSDKVIDQAVEEMRFLLRERHNIYNPEADPAKDDFKIMSQKETAKILGNVLSIFTVLLASIAAISLVVGGIGIMNIMLVAVAERTREIGLRKAVGALNRDILGQFLLESAILTLLGGVFGIILGGLLSFAASLAIGFFVGSSWGFLLPWNAVVLGVGVSGAIGLIFGIYPARRAAVLNPIEALRHE